jgi:hypothetical protein
MMRANPFVVGDQVVLLDRTGQLRRDASDQLMRGEVVRVWWSECHVRLRGGDVVASRHALLRRCPQLAYCRPARQSAGAA